MFIVGEKLETAQIVPTRAYFYYYAWKKKLRGQIREGDYVIPARASLAEITDLFTKGESKVIKKEEITVTLPEGWTAEKMAKRITEKGLAGDDFLVVAQKPSRDLLAEFDFLTGRTALDGYLFPDTYKFFPEATGEDIARKMLATYDLKITPQLRADIAGSGRNLHDVMILASIVEGEVNQGIDRSQVAGVFTNRLDIGMGLESDATIDFIKGIPEIKHTLADTKIDNPYNTYLYPGLPPGPINNPSLDSIVATISPAETEYFFFLNNATTGETVFSKTFQEHIINKGKNGL